MNIEVTRDNVTILEQSETPHENEYKITTCYFTFDEFTGSFQVKRAIFTILSTGEMYETDIINNQCDIPSEVLKHEYETVKLGVYGYNIGDNEELLNRFSPSYAEIVVPTGSYKEGALSPEPITPSQYDLYSQALQEGLQEVDDKLDEVVETVDGKIEEVDNKLIEVDTTVNNKMTEVDNKIGEVDDKLDEVDDKIAEVDTAITETNNLNLDVSDKVDGDVTVTLTKKDASTKSVVISDGTSLQFMWQGTSLGIKTDDMQEYVFVDLQGIQGVPGPQGEPFRIKKTYSSVAEMNADFNNMEYGDYVMIASTVEVEDNAKLYTRGEREWIFITDFSGAQGIKGETGATPNIQIGTVTSGSVPSVTRTGTNENPVLNFVLQPGEKGNTGETGATGNGIASITKTSTTGLVDTYTITFTDGNTTTFNVENGNGIDHISLTSQSGATKVYTIYYTDGTTSEYTVQDGEVTQEVFDEEIERANMIYNAMPKVSGEGTDLTLDNTAECPVYDIELKPSELEQESTSGKNILNPVYIHNGAFTNFDNLTNENYIETDNTKYRSIKIDNLPAGTYTLSINWNETARILRWVGDNTLYPLTYTDTNTYTFTTTTTGLFGICFRNSTSTDFSDNDYTVQIEEGSTATSYEPFTYGASPNPQYPQEIHTVSGENSVKIQNKNLFDEEYELGTINYNTGALENSTTIIRTKNYQSIKPSTQYTLKVPNEVTGIILYYYNNGSYIGGVQPIIGSTTHTITFTTNANANQVKWRFNANYTTINNQTMLNIGTSAISYIPHQEQAYPLSLGDLEYCKIGDYEDEFFKNVVGSDYYDSTLELDKWYLKKNIGKNTLTSFSGSVSSNVAYFGLSSRARTISNSQVIYCDKLNFGGNYTSLDNAIAGMSANQISVNNNGSSINVFMKIPNCTSIVEYNNYISNNNLTIYYQLATPTNILLSETLQTQLDNIQKAITYQEQTNVSQTNNDLPFVIKLSAIRDLSGIFELIQ